MNMLSSIVVASAITLVGATGTGAWWLVQDYTVVRQVSANPVIIELREKVDEVEMVASSGDIRSLQNQIDWLQRLVWAQEDRMAAGGNTPSARDRLRELKQQLARARAELERRFKR